MRSLTIQFSALIGTLTLVSQITSGTPIQDAVYRGLATAGAIFLVMLLGDLAIQAVTRAHEAAPLPTSNPKLRRHEPEEQSDALAA